MSDGQCWGLRLTANYIFFIHSLIQYLLSTYCILGHEMDTVLGTENMKMRDKVKEL